MEHSELVAELAYIDKLSTQERLKLARKRRMQQLKKWSQKEKEIFSTKKEKTALNEAQKRRKRNEKGVFFASNVMILEAAARNDIDEVRTLLEMGVNPDSTNEDGLTALHQCCIDDSEEMMRLLVHYGANVNAQDSEKWTPLHAAATCGHLHLAKFLIANGANLLAVNADGNMPYDICEDDATLDYIESEMAARGVTQQLIDETRFATEKKMLNDLQQTKEEGKSLMFKDEHGATPLHVAAANGYIHVVDYLLSQNLPTEVKDNDDWTPLHAAACWGHPDVLELLAQHGANLQAQTRNQETPYDICEDAELRERILQLVNEQETKKLHDQTRRIRRVRSNKRTQSIRRTSIREKTLTPKKEAQEEARMRLQLENKYHGEENSTILPDICLLGGMGDLLSKPVLFSTSSPYKNDDNFSEIDGSVNNAINSEEKDESRFFQEDTIEEVDENKKEEIFYDKDSQETTAAIEKLTSFNSEDSSNKVLEGVCPIESSPPVPPPRNLSVSKSDAVAPRPLSDSLSSNLNKSVLNHSRSDPNSSKIDIHVTVTVNPFAPGTLADLKKQRALSRASQNSYTLNSSNGGAGTSSSVFSLNTSQEVEPGSPTLGATSPSITNSSLKVEPIVYPPASPSRSPRRFCGEPSDIIGKTDRWACCTLM